MRGNRGILQRGGSGPHSPRDSCPPIALKNRRRRQAGFSLGEMIATVVIGAMILTAILGIYSRANQAANAVLDKVESPALASEVLQLMARDLDRLLGADDAIVQIRNGLDNHLARAELVIRRMFHDKDNKEQVLEEITWRAGYDREGDTPGLVIYRSREGMGREDRLLENQRKDWEKNYPFVPICRGVTFFRIEAFQGEDLVDQWPPSAPPTGVKITLSFAEPFETVQGALDVPEEYKISRTIAINGMRKIRFALDASDDPNQVQDPNQERLKEPASDAGGQDAKDRKTTGQMTNNSKAKAKTKTPSPRGSAPNARTPVQTRRK